MRGFFGFNYKIMRKKKIGENAGVVWCMLYGLDDWETLEGVARKTKLNIIEIAAAIGWLAREDKIMIREEGAVTYFTVYHEHYY